MKKILSLIMCLIMIISIAPLSVFADTSAYYAVSKTGNEVAVELAVVINAIEEGLCEVNENVVTLCSDVYLEETLVIPCGGAVVINFNEFSMHGPDIVFCDDDTVCSVIYVPMGAELTITGDGQIRGGDGNRDYRYTDGGHGIFNDGTLTIDNMQVSAGDGRYREKSPEGRVGAYGGYGICNNGNLTILDGDINGGKSLTGYSGNGGHGIYNRGTLVMQDGDVSGGNGFGGGEAPESVGNEITYGVYGGCGIDNESGTVILYSGYVSGGDGDTYGGEAITNLASIKVYDVSLYGGSSEGIGGDGSSYGSSGLLNQCDGDVELIGAYVRGKSGRPGITNNAYLTIGGETNVNSEYTAIENLWDGVLTVNSGNICGGEIGISNQNIVIINDGNISCSGENARGTDVVKSCGIANWEQLTVNGGILSGGTHEDIPTYGVVNGAQALLNGGEIKGGYIYSANSYAKAIDGEFAVGENKILMECDDEYGEYVKNQGATSDKSFLKIVENKPGMELAEIINSIQADACYYDSEQDSVILKSDLLLSNVLEITIRGDIVLDLNYYEIDMTESNAYGISIFEDTNLTIKNGIIKGPGEGRALANHGGKLNIYNCTVYGGDSTLDNDYTGRALDNFSGEAYIENCYMYGGNGDRFGGCAINNSATMVIKSGEFYGGEGSGDDNHSGNAIYNSYSSNAVLTIHAGKFVGELAINGANFVKGGNAYIQESVDGEIYVHTENPQSTKPYMIVMQENTATKLARIINEYDAEACHVLGNCVYMNKEIEIDDEIEIPEGNEVEWDITGATINGIHIPQGANLKLLGDGVVKGDISKGGENWVSDDAIENLGTLKVYGGTIIGGETNLKNGGYAGNGIGNWGTLAVCGGTITGGTALAENSFAGSGIVNGGEGLEIYGGIISGGDAAYSNAYPGHGINTANNLSVVVNDGKLIGGTGIQNDGQAIAGPISGGQAIRESDDDITYTLIYSSTPSKKYIVADEGIGAEALVVEINLQKDNSAKISEDMDSAILLSDFENLNILHFAPINLNGHSVSGTLTAESSVELVGSGYVNAIETKSVVLDGKGLTVNTLYGNLHMINGVVNNFTGEDIYMENGIINNTITEFREICMTGGTIKNGIIFEPGGNRIIIEGGKILQSDLGRAIYVRHAAHPEIVITGGEVYGILLDRTHHEGEDRPCVYLNGGTVIGGINANVIGNPSGGGSGGAGGGSVSGGLAAYSSSTEDTYIVSLSKGLVIGNEGERAISHNFIIEDGTRVKESADGVTYTEIFTNSSDMRYLKAGLISEPEVDFGGGISGGSSASYGNIFTHNFVHDGETASFDMILYSNDTMQGDVYVCVYDGDRLSHIEKYEAVQERPVSVECTDGQKIKIFWWKDNLKPQSNPAEIEL